MPNPYDPNTLSDGWEKQQVLIRFDDDTSGDMGVYRFVLNDPLTDIVFVEWITASAGLQNKFIVIDEFEAEGQSTAKITPYQQPAPPLPVSGDLSKPTGGLETNTTITWTFTIANMVGNLPPQYRVYVTDTLPIIFATAPYFSVNFTGNSGEAVATGLTPNTAYYAAAYASNDINFIYSETSDPVSTTNDIAPSGSFGAFSATSTTDTSLTVEVDASAVNPGTPAPAYVIFGSTNPLFNIATAQFSAAAMVTGTVGTPGATISNAFGSLSPITAYYFIAIADNDVSPDLISNTSGALITLDTAVGGTFGSFTSTNITSTTIDFEINTGGITGTSISYEVYYDVSTPITIGNPGVQGPVAALMVGGGLASFSIGSLTPSTTYFFKVRAFNPINNVDSATSQPFATTL